MVYDTVSVLISHENVIDATETISDAYYEKLKTLSSHAGENSKSDLKIIYTAMHGVGCKWVITVFLLSSIDYFFF